MSADSAVCVQVSSLLWMRRRERNGVLPLKPLCLGNMAARAKLIGKKKDLSLPVTFSELSSDTS